MVDRVETAIVKLWGRQIGAIAWLDDRGYAEFEYDPDFLKLNLDIAPVHMSLEAARRGNTVFSFPTLSRETFLGLPGMLADVLPGKFGNAVIDAWLARNGRDSTSFSPIARLCYIGNRGMGALEFEPANMGKFSVSVPVEISELVNLAQTITRERQGLDLEIGQSEKDNADALLDILRVGASAGGARPKAVIAMDDKGHVRSGQVEAPKNYDYWILKFDGVTDLELGESRGYGRIEYAYYLMAKAAGITMTECRLLEENGRAHFMTKRFDRTNVKKLHMQSLCGIAHYDFNMAGAYSYEQAFTIMRKLRLSKAEAAEQFRRMVFNVLSRNLDDHTKNISFIMTPDGKWRLSPAYDITYAHNPKGKWTDRHQMSINGKRDNITKEDLLQVADSISLHKAGDVIEEIQAALEKWTEFAQTARVKPSVANEIRRNFIAI